MDASYPFVSSEVETRWPVEGFSTSLEANGVVNVRDQLEVNRR